MTQPNLDLGKLREVCPELAGLEPRLAVGHDYWNAIAARILELAGTIEKVRDYIGCGIHDEDGNLKSECTISITELDNCFEWLDEALGTRKGGPHE